MNIFAGVEGMTLLAIALIAVLFGAAIREVGIFIKQFLIKIGFVGFKDKDDDTKSN